MELTFYTIEFDKLLGLKNFLAETDENITKCALQTIFGVPKEALSPLINLLERLMDYQNCAQLEEFFNTNCIAYNENHVLIYAGMGLKIVLSHGDK